MAFVTTLEQLKQFAPASLGLNIKDILPYLEEVERSEIKKVLGKELFDVLKSDFEDDPEAMEEELAALLKEVRRPLIDLAIAKYIPFGSVHVSSTGIQELQTENNRSATKWRTEKLEKSLLDSGYRKLEDLFEFLEENRADYPTWEASSEFSLLYDCFVYKASIFNKYHEIGNSRRLFIGLKAIMQRVENTYVRPILLNNLFTLIKNALKAAYFPETPASTTIVFDETKYPSDVDLIYLIQADVSNAVIIDESIPAGFASNALYMIYVKNKFIAAGYTAEITDNSMKITFPLGFGATMNGAIVTVKSRDENASTFTDSLSSSPAFAGGINASVMPPRIKVLLENYIQSAVVYFTIATALLEKSIFIDENGVTVYKTVNTMAFVDRMDAKDERTNRLASMLEKNGKDLLHNLNEYLKTNISTYPELLAEDDFTLEGTTTMINTPERKTFNML